MKEIIIEGLNPGDVLASHVIVNRNILVKSGSVITGKLIAKLKEFGVISVYIESGEEDEIAEEITPSRELKTVNLKSGEYICHQGDLSDSIYVLKDGFLDVLVNDQIVNSVNNKKEVVERKIAEICGYNVNFGEIGAILGVERSASVKAVTSSEILVIPVDKDSFVFSMKKHPDLGLSIAETMAGRLKEIDNKIRVLTQFSKKLEQTIEYNANAFYSLVQRISKVYSENPNELWIGKLTDFLKSHEHYNYAVKSFRKSSSEDSDYEKTQKDEIVYFISKDIIEFEKGQIICNEGDVGRDIYILIAGRIGVFVGEERVATISFRGSVIGEIAVLNSFRSGKYEKRTATLKAITYTQIVVIPGSELVQRVIDDPGIIAQINTSLAERLPVADKSYIDIRDKIIKELEVLDQEELYSYMSNTFNSHLSLVEFILKDEFKLIQLLKNKISIDINKFREEFSFL